MLRVLFNRPEALSIHQPHINSPVDEGPAPNVDASCAGRRSGTGVESRALGKEHIEQERLTCSVLPANGNKTEVSLELPHAGQGLRTELEFLIIVGVLSSSLGSCVISESTLPSCYIQILYYNQNAFPFSSIPLSPYLIIYFG
jgi:hypothetical protein